MLGLINRALNISVPLKPMTSLFKNMWGAYQVSKQFNK